MAEGNADHKLEKALMKLHEAVAELQALRYQPMWPAQMDSLKNAILALEDRMQHDRGMLTAKPLSETA